MPAPEVHSETVPPMRPLRRRTWSRSSSGVSNGCSVWIVTGRSRAIAPAPWQPSLRLGHEEGVVDRHLTGLDDPGIDAGALRRWLGDLQRALAQPDDTPDELVEPRGVHV